MKKGFITIILLVIVCSTAISQVSISKGIKGGLNYSILAGENSYGTFFITRYCAGIFIEIQLPSIVAIESDVLYSVKGYWGDGWVDTGGIGGIYTKMTQELSYIEIPILLKIYLSKSAVKISFYGGLSLDLLVDAKNSVDIPDYGSVVAYNKDYFTSGDFGIIIGTGLKIPFNKIDLTIDGRYNLGLAPIYKNGFIKAYNSVFSVMAGIGF